VDETIKDRFAKKQTKKSHEGACPGTQLNGSHFNHPNVQTKTTPLTQPHVVPNPQNFF